MKFLLVSILLISTSSWAIDKMALLTSVEGQVQVLRPTSAGSNEPAESLMSYEGKRYTFKKAKIGAPLASDESLMTSADGKTKIIYPGGDVVIIGPNSFVSISATYEARKTPLAKITYGKLRAVIDPKGSLSGLKIKTPSAVAGVRGTDLYVSYDQAAKETKVTTIRGQVQVIDEKKKTVTEIKKGEVLQISKSTDTQKPVVRAANQNDLGKVQADSYFEKESSKLDALPEKNKKEIEQANKMAEEKIIQDMSRYDENLGKEVAAGKAKSVDELNAKALYVVYKEAPPAPNSEKADALYEKYFKSLGL